MFMKRKIIKDTDYQVIVKMNIIEGWPWVTLRHTVRYLGSMTKKSKDKTNQEKQSNKASRHVLTEIQSVFL